jgi:dTDP-4-dehydrorhamnose 3,5-epimerase
VRFERSAIPGLVIVHSEAVTDERGSFARVWCRDRFAEEGLPTRFVQCSISSNHRRGTLRGLHYQEAPWAEAKLVRCVRGSAYDVALDLREGSPAWGHWAATVLDAAQGNAVVIPEGCAHGFQTLEDGTALLYEITAPYHAAAARGVRWNDPRFGILWPIMPPYVSERDERWPIWGGPEPEAGPR